MARNCCRYVTVSLVPTAALVLAFVFAAGILILPIFYEELSVRYKYGVVIDAGSTHNNLFVYRWEVPTQKWTQTDTGEVKEVSSGCISNTPLNSYTSDPAKAQDAFGGCVEKSYMLVPKEHRSTMPIYLGATAGMRLVELNDSTISGRIMGNATAALQGSEYKFGSAAILPGPTEAAAGWATANYAQHKAKKFTSGTTGSLDMGGASMEIAFLPADGLAIQPEFLSKEVLFGHSYNLYARSYLCYGQREAHSRLLAALVDVQPKPKNLSGVHNPCLFNGATVNYTYETVYSLCANSSIAVDVFGSALQPLVSAPPSFNITFIGKGDPGLCSSIVQAVFNLTNCSSSGDNCAGPRYIAPPVQGEYVAFSGFYYTAKFFNQLDRNHTHWDSYKSNVASFCRLNYQQALSRNGSDSYLLLRCFDALFHLHLLEHGLGFNSSAQWSVRFMDKVHDLSVGWAMGYLLNATSAIPQSDYVYDRPYSAVDMVVGIIVLSILCVVFVVFFCLTFYACRKVISARSGYQDIA